MAIAGLVAMSASAIGLAGSVAAILLLTPGYQLFQTANNTAVLADAQSDRRGVLSGMLNLSRNLGLVTGASAMGALFAAGTSAADMATAPSDAVARGMAVTFAVASLLILVALGLLAADSGFSIRRATR